MGQAALVGVVFPSADRVVRHVSATSAIQERAAAPGFNSILKRRLDSVQRFEAFSEIPGSDCAAIVVDAQEMQFQRHSTVFSEGSPATRVALLLSGCMKITQGRAQGQEVILRLNGPGDVLGKLGSQARANHLYTTYAVQPSLALVWEMDAFERLVDRFPLLRRNSTIALLFLALGLPVFAQSTEPAQNEPAVDQPVPHRARVQVPCWKQAGMTPDMVNKRWKLEDQQRGRIAQVCTEPSTSA